MIRGACGQRGKSRFEPDSMEWCFEADRTVTGGRSRRTQKMPFVMAPAAASCGHAAPSPLI